MLPLGRRLLDATDPAVMARRLAPLLADRWADFQLGDLAVPRVLPRKDGGFTIQYRLTDHDGARHLFWGALQDDAAPPPGWAADASDPTLIRDADLGLSVPLFPADPRLRRLPRILDGAGADLARETLGAATEAPAVTSILAYRLERRCVLRIHIGEAGETTGSVVLKVVPRSRLARFVAGHERLHAAVEHRHDPRTLAIPRILATDPELGVYVMEDVAGHSLHRADTGALVEDHARAGAALRALHGLSPGESPVRTVTAELDQLATWVDRIARVFPDLDARFRGALATVAESSGRAADLAPTRPALIHGDFYDKQVLCSAERTTVLDTDNLTAGDPAQDVGNFLAHVLLRRLQGRDAAAVLADAGSAFLRGYAADDEALDERAGWWRQATILRLAALYLLRPRWRHLCPRLLEEIETCVRSRP
jgi:hypothetical protein